RSERFEPAPAAGDDPTRGATARVRPEPRAWRGEEDPVDVRPPRGARWDRRVRRLQSEERLAARVLAVGARGAAPRRDDAIRLRGSMAIRIGRGPRRDGRGVEPS